jgi:hypothetical protein
VAAGLLLGAAQGFLMAGSDSTGMATFLSVLGRASQGIINGVLVAYALKPKAPLWRGGLVGGALGGLLGGLAGIPAQEWTQIVPWSAVVGVGCGLAAARAGR